jgi:hypothetical protein
LQFLSRCSPDHITVAEILLQVPNLRTSGQSAVFCWVPGHCGLPSNEVADAAAKATAMQGRSFQIELAALRLALEFVALFYPPGKPKGTMLLATNCIW